MEIELVPDPDAADPALRAAVTAIEQTGLADDVRSPATVSAWRRAGVLEAVDRDTAPRDAARTGAQTEHAPPRSGPPDALSPDALSPDTVQPDNTPLGNTPPA